MGSGGVVKFVEQVKSVKRWCFCVSLFWVILIYYPGSYWWDIKRNST